MHRQKARYILFYVLFVYVLAQLFWWGFQLIQSYQKNVTDTHLLQYKIWMILGEGSVFLILLFIGFRYIHKSIKKDIQSAQLESTFLLSFTHELKTPIASIRLMLDTLLIRKTNEELQKQMVKDAQQELLRLQNQIENILLTTRTQSNSFEKKDEETSLEKLIQEPIQKIQKWFPTSTIKVNLKENSMIFFDQELFSSLILNILENAIVHSQSTRPIEAHFGIENKTLLIEIKDSGNGIPDNIQSQITKRFFRSDNGQQMTKGTGLGLYLADSIVKHYRGTLTFHANVPSGTIVKIQLPI